jgi:GDP-L-fucose synthase
MKILVCGASGFMGRNLFEYFTAQGHEVYGTAWDSDSYHDNVTYVNLKDEEDIRDLFDSLRPDVVIQAAATTSGIKDILEKPYIHVTDNAVMNSLLLRAAYSFKVKHFIFLSCSVMYQPSEIPQKETDWDESKEILKQYFGVGYTKVYIEKMCEFYSRLGMKCTAVRHSNTYGPYDKFDPDHSHVLGATVRKVMEATDTVEVWGTGEEKKDLVYVTDVVRAIDILIQKQTQSFERVNVSSGIGLTINGLVQKVIERAGKTLNITHNTSKPSNPVHLVYDSSYMKEKYGWEPQVSMEEGLDMTIKWFKENYKGTTEHARFQ